MKAAWSLASLIDPTLKAVAHRPILEQPGEVDECAVGQSPFVNSVSHETINNDGT